jgi:hypothetical protein
MGRFPILAGVVAAAMAIPTAAAAGPCPELELVLAVDVSNSVDRREFRLQTHGIAHAFRDASVRSAIRGVGGISANVLFWGDPAYGVQEIGRTEIRDDRDAEAFARLVETAPRLLTGNTGLGAAISASLDRLDTPEACGRRKVVDVSGDGRESLFRPSTVTRETPVVPVELARLRALAAGVTVNGLAILNDEADLADYFAREVAVGPGSFVLTADGYDDFAAAMTLKLLREIEPTIGALDPVSRLADLEEAR